MHAFDRVASRANATFIVAHGLPRAISAALELMGTSVGPLRAPLQALPPEAVAVLRRILVDLDVDSEIAVMASGLE